MATTPNQAADNCGNPSAPPNMQPQPQPSTPQQFIHPATFQYPQMLGNILPMNASSPTQMQPTSYTAPDPVLQTILHKIENIESQMGQLGQIHSAVKTITERLDTIDRKIVDIERSQNFLSDQFDTVSSSVTENQNDLREAKREIQRLTAVNVE